MLKTILCYGDSNTWGYVPQPSGSSPQRYERNQRWTGCLQSLLGEQFYIIEEGLSGRTTDLDHDVPPDRNGKRYLSPCLYTHAPIDLIILALGSNDLKTCFNRLADDIIVGLSVLVDIIQTSSYGP